MSSCPARSSASRAATISAAHDDGCVGCVVVASGVAVAEVWGLLGAALEVTTLDGLDGLDEPVTAPAAPVAPPLVALPVEHAATSDVRAKATTTGTVAQDGIRLGITRPYA